MGRTGVAGSSATEFQAKFSHAAEDVPARIELRGMNEPEHSNNQAKFHADSDCISRRSLSIVRLRVESIGVLAVRRSASCEDIDSA